MAKQYPRIGSTGFREKWKKKPETAPRCIVPSCAARATHKPCVEVNWFRGDDEVCGPVCKEHSTEARLLLIVTADWKAEQKAKQDAADQRKRDSAPGVEDGS